MTEVAVTDTHALIWYARSERRKLGTEARKLFDAADEGRVVIYVPSLVLAEIAEGLRRGSVRFGDSFAGWSCGESGGGMVSRTLPSREPGA